MPSQGQVRSGLLLCGAALVVSVSAGAQSRRAQDDPEVLKSRILSALRRSTLSTAALQPFRLQAHITLYDGSGKHPLAGTLDLLHRGRETRISLVLPTATEIYLSTPKGNYSQTQGEIPFFTPALVRAIQKPANFNGFDIQDAKAPAPAGELCLVVLPTNDAVIDGKRSGQDMICLDPANDNLKRVVQGDQTLIRDEFESFDDHEVAHKLKLQVGAFTVGEATIDTFHAEAFTDADFTPSAKMHLIGAGPKPLDAASVSSHLLKHEMPKYPGLAKAAHISGVVVAQAIIDTDGHIRKVWIISSPDKLLSEAVMKTVPKWVYTPFEEDGKPVEVETTISTNFAVGSH